MTVIKKLSLLAFISMPICAQSVITGKVLGPKQDSASHVKVILERDTAGPQHVVYTDATGVYRISVETGTYTLHAETANFKSATKQVSVGPKGTFSADLTLQPNPSEPMAFDDEPHFTVAGVTDNTYRGGHGADTVLRSSEDLSKATSNLKDGSSGTALAMADESSGNYLKAAREFQAEAELHPTEGNLFDWGAELLKHLAPQAAEEVFANGATRYPNSLRMLLGRAVACYSEGAYEQAEHLFLQAIEMAPNDAGPYLFLGKAEAHEITASSQYQEAMKQFAARHPESAVANYLFARTLWNSAKEDGASDLAEQALSLLKKATRIDPHMARALLLRGVILASEREFKEAADSLHRAVAEDPTLAEAHYRLSDLYRINGDKARSEEELRVYQQLSKSDNQKREQERRELQQFVVELQTSQRH